MRTTTNHPPQLPPRGYTHHIPLIMPNPAQAKMAGDAIVAMMAELARRLSVLSEEDRRRMLDEYAPLMAVLQWRHSEALAEHLPKCC